MNRRIPNGTYGGVEGRQLTLPPIRFAVCLYPTDAAEDSF